MKTAILPDFSYEDMYDGPVCGIDEVGRGPLAGPVVAAAVIIRREDMPQEVLRHINDSKKLNAQKRAWLYSKIHEYADVSLAQVEPDEIDRINILQASLLAMSDAFHKLGKAPVAALVDGNKPPKLVNDNVKVVTIVKGDAKSLSIAAASIVAKHHRDEIMKKYAQEFPHYGWETNAGYGTKAHLKAIEIHGITPLHRRSFAPISKQSVKENSANN